MNRIFIIIFLLLITSCSSNTKKIAIQPYGNIDTIILDSISQILSKTYGAETYIYSKINLPREAFINVKSPRYRADSLLVYLQNDKPDSIDFIIGVTSKDISTTKRDKKGNIKEPKQKYSDWGVVGLGFRPGSSCVISTFRLKHNHRNIYFDRIKKVSIHEIGHNMGLKHCKTQKCVMQDAVETIATIDNCNKELCKLCSNKI